MSDSDLIKDLDKKFDKFAGVVLHVDEQLGDLKNRLSSVENKVDHLQTSMDNLTKMVKDFHEEIIVTRKRLDLLEEWARKVSEKVGIPLPF